MFYVHIQYPHSHTRIKSLLLICICCDGRKVHFTIYPNNTSAKFELPSEWPSDLTIWVAVGSFGLRLVRGLKEFGVGVKGIKNKNNCKVYLFQLSVASS